MVSKMQTEERQTGTTIRRRIAHDQKRRPCPQKKNALSNQHSLDLSIEDYDSGLRRVEKRTQRHLRQMDNWEGRFIHNAKRTLTALEQLQADSDHRSATPSAFPNLINRNALGNPNAWDQMRSLQKVTAAQRLYLSASRKSHQILVWPTPFCAQADACHYS